MSFWRRHVVLASFSFLLLGFTARAGAQVSSSSTSASGPASAADTGSYNAPLPYSRDLAVSGFAQFSSATNGNFIREDTTTSYGGLLSFRQARRLWLGYEANYGFTHYTDTYYYGATQIPHGTHELSLAYLLQGPSYLGLRPFLTLGGGSLIFTPTVTGYGTDPKRLFVYGIGLQHSIVGDRLGIRIQYRGLKYGTPAFGQLSLNTHLGRSSYEPTIGIFYRF